MTVLDLMRLVVIVDLPHGEDAGIGFPRTSSYLRLCCTNRGNTSNEGEIRKAPASRQAAAWVSENTSVICSRTSR